MTDSLPIKWMKARKKPIEIEFREVIPDCSNSEFIETLEGTLVAKKERDFVIRGAKGELYPIRKDIFYEIYTVTKKKK